MSTLRHFVYVEQGFPGSTQPGGAGTYVALIGAALAARGHIVSVIALNRTMDDGRWTIENYGRLPIVHRPSSVVQTSAAEWVDGMTVYRPVARLALHWYLSKLPGLQNFLRP